MPLPCRTVTQVCGFTLSLFGWVSSCFTTSMTLWKSLNLDLNEFEVWNMGLWHVCVVQDVSVMDCKRQPSLLALPWDLQVSRILMVTSNILGFLGLSLSVLGSHWLKMSSLKEGLKKHLRTAGGIFFCLSGITTFVPVSWVAYNIVQEFWDETLPKIMPRWEFGHALFLGWFSGFSLLVGGLLLLSSTCCPETERQPGHPTVHQRKEVPRLPLLRNPSQYAPHRNASLAV